MLAPVREAVAQAETALGRHDARQAIAVAQAASEHTAQIGTLLTRFTEVRGGIVQGRNDAERLQAEGYRTERSQAALDQARAALSDTATTLQQQGVAYAEARLQVAQAALDEAVANGRGLVELRAENDQRIPAIEREGQAVAAHIAEGRRVFDIVDEFAESTWSDIRGNGSEAQAVADRAQEHWTTATHLSTMEAQEFIVAKENLDAAAQELGYARELVDAIIQRLRDLETSRDTARNEIDDAARDIARGWAFVHANDPDVGKVPEEQLQQAEAQLATAQAEIQQAKPDWLRLVRQAQAANHLADEALAEAVSEAEAMEKLRSKTGNAQQLASAEVQKIVKFASLHDADISAENHRAIDQIQQQVQQAYQALQRANQTEEEQRRAALEEAYTRYSQLQSAAAEVYQAVYGNFQRLEKLRDNVNRELALARKALVDAESLIFAYGRAIPSGAPEVRRISQARRAFDQIKLPINGEERLNQVAELARSIRNDVREAVNDIQRNYRRHDDDDPGDFLTGMLIGGMLNSGSRSHSGGWGGSGGWSGGGGSSGGGWGGLGGGGGSWGGGGGGGGSFGGGGGGGGGW